MSKDLTKWIPTVTIAIVAVIGQHTGAVDAFIAGHPALSALVCGLTTILGHLSASPVQK